MIDPLRPFRALAFLVRRFWSRRAARRLVAGGLPRGLTGAPRPSLLSLRVPPLIEPHDLEFRALPLGAQAIRGRVPGLLLRLSALPEPPLDLGVVRERPAPGRLEPRVLQPRVLYISQPLARSAPPIAVVRELAAPRSFSPRLLTPRPLTLVPPLETRVRDLGIARPRLFRLDAELRLPAEAEPLRISSDSPPPARPRRLRPRTPLARAPIWRLRPRNLRLDPRTHAPSNEGILPLEKRDLAWGWVRTDFRREIVDLQWMAQDRIDFLAPRPVEWFTMWWFEHDQRRPGAHQAIPYQLPRELSWALDECKEQMLIRRDVKKDETELEPSNFFYENVGMPISALEHVPLASLVPEKQWMEPAGMLDPLPEGAYAREVYLQWRTLLNALEER